MQTTSLGNAYGACVMFVTMFDTIMVGLVAIIVWQIRPLFVALPFLIIICMDGTFLSSVLTKVPDGAWFTLALAALLAMFLLIWRFGKEQQWSAEAEDRFPTSHFFTTQPNGTIQLAERFGSAPITSTPGVALFFDKVGDKTPIVLSQFVLKLSALPAVKILVHLRPLDQPSVTEHRFHVTRLAMPNYYRVVVRYGYNDEIITPDLAAVICDQVAIYLTHQQAEPTALQAPLSTSADPHDMPSPPTTNPDEKARVFSRSNSHADDLKLLRAAQAQNVLYIMGKEEMKIKPLTTGYFRAVVLWIFVWVRENTRGKMASLQLPIENMVEVGFLKEI